MAAKTDRFNEDYLKVEEIERQIKSALKERENALKSGQSIGRVSTDNHTHIFIKGRVLAEEYLLVKSRGRYERSRKTLLPVRTRTSALSLTVRIYCIMI